MSVEIAITTGLVGIGIIFSYLAVKFERKELQTLFLFFSLYSVFLLIDVSAKLTESSYADISTLFNALNGGFIWVMVLVALYVLIMFILEVLGFAVGTKPKKYNAL